MTDPTREHSGFGGSEVGDANGNGSGTRELLGQGLQSRTEPIYPAGNGYGHGTSEIYGSGGNGSGGEPYGRGQGYGFGNHRGNHEWIVPIVPCEVDAL